MHICTAMKPSSHLNILAGDTLFAMPILAVILLGFFNDVSLSERWIGTYPIWQQILSGLAIGLASAWLAETVLNLKKLNNVMDKYSGVLGGFQLSKLEMLWLSMCAGVGEELLFRGALQWIAIEYLGFWWGIGLTSILFIAIHGYLNPKNGNIFLYGFFLTTVIFAWGFLNESCGIWMVIVAHATFDYYLLSKMDEPSPEPYPILYKHEQEEKEQN